MLYSEFNTELQRYEVLYVSDQTEGPVYKSIFMTEKYNPDLQKFIQWVNESIQKDKNKHV